jgi:hypothetical protein
MLQLGVDFRENKNNPRILVTERAMFVINSAGIIRDNTLRAWSGFVDSVLCSGFVSLVLLEVLPLIKI